MVRGIANGKPISDALIFEDLPSWRAFVRASETELERESADRYLTSTLIGAIMEADRSAEGARSAAAAAAAAPERDRNLEGFPSYGPRPVVVRPGAARSEVAARLRAGEEAGPSAWGGAAWSAGLRAAQGFAKAHLGALGPVKPVGVSYHLATADGLPAVGRCAFHSLSEKSTKNHIPLSLSKKTRTNAHSPNGG